jgi:hypothetical protein
MASINVYRYDYYDPVLKRERRSVDYATGDAIMKIHGTILSETLQSVDEGVLERDGTVRAADVFTEPARSPRRGRHEPRRAA